MKSSLPEADWDVKGSKERDDYRQCQILPTR